MVTSFLFVNEMENRFLPGTKHPGKGARQAPAHGIVIPGISVHTLGDEAKGISSYCGVSAEPAWAEKVSVSRPQDIMAVTILRGRSRAVHCGMPTTSLASVHAKPAAPTQL